MQPQILQIGQILKGREGLTTEGTEGAEAEWSFFGRLGDLSWRWGAWVYVRGIPMKRLGDPEKKVFKEEGK